MNVGCYDQVVVGRIQIHEGDSIIFFLYARKLQWYFLSHDHAMSHDAPDKFYDSFSIK